MITSKKLFELLCISSILLATSGCAKYKKREVPTNIPSKVEKENVQIGARQLSDKECHAYFSRRVKKKNLKAYQLVVSNKGSQPYTLDTNDLGLDLASRDGVVNALELDPTPRLIGWATAGLLLGPVFWITTAVEWGRCSKANKAMAFDFERRVLDSNEKVNIPAGASINKLFFVHENDVAASTNSFTAVVKNNDAGQSINFDIELA
ncbi:MAG: hypothetical protein H6679_01305 [Epsilonproteobacteria bacterium]|nr:hypothetical protein [Campylobacterota bacterium]